MAFVTMYGNNSGVRLVHDRQEYRVRDGVLHIPEQLVEVAQAQGFSLARPIGFDPTAQPRAAEANA